MQQRLVITREEVRQAFKVEEDNGSYVLPVFIEATHRRTHMTFAVGSCVYDDDEGTESVGLCKFKSDDVTKFDTVAEATEMLETLSVMYGNSYAFSVMSYQCIINDYR